MPADRTRNAKTYQIRARLPLAFRIIALCAIGVALIFVVNNIFNQRSRSAFKLKGEHATLSTDVTAEVNNYERLESENGVSKYYVKASHAKTFADNHQELQDLYLEVYGADGSSTDRLSAEKALYIPEENKNFTAYLNGNVDISTRDALRVKTNNVVYTRKDETASIDEAVDFEWRNIKGKSVGATVRMADKQLDLAKDVEIDTFETAELAKSGIRSAHITSGSASFDQVANRIELRSDVAISIDSKAKDGGAQKSDIRSGRALIMLAPQNGRPATEPTGSIMDGSAAEVRTVEFFDSVKIISSQNGQAPTTIDAGYAMFDKVNDRFELRQGTHIVTASDDRKTDIKANEADYERADLRLALRGAVEITQDADYLKGDTVNANLFAGDRIKDAVVRGNAFARQTTTERTSNISAPQLNAAFDESRVMKTANAVGASRVEVVPVNDPAYSRIDMNAAAGIAMMFKGAGLIESMRTDGRTTLQLTAPSGKPDAANKRVTADALKTTFAANGKDIAKAEAVGSAELFIEPLVADRKNYRTTVNAPRFDCDFYAGNNAKSCVAGKKAKAVRVPTVADGTRGEQTITADQLTAIFGEASHDVETLEAAENAKYNEQDRNAVARQMTFTEADGMVRLRGGEPTVWDSRGRAKAGEIDIDSRANKSFLRGSVSATYYSRKQINDAAPFGSSEKPVFVTSETAEFDHDRETAVFVKNARGWQENNFVRGDRLVIDQRAGRLDAEGSVQSALYNARNRKAKQESVPVFASAARMSYDKDKRVLQYRDSVDIRQGTDRLTAGAADVLLDENNEISSTVAENTVVITQPGRRAAGDWVQYTASDETAILRGSPASVSDAENGSSQAGQLTFNMRENRVVSEAKTKQATAGRIRSVYKIKSNP